MLGASAIRAVTTPLGLAALVLVILYGIYKLIFERSILSNIGAEHTAKLVGRIINWLGALALVALCLVLAQPYVLGRSEPNELNQKLNAMTASFGQEQYDVADLRAQEVLQIAPNNPRALAMRGIVAFYGGAYQTAAQYFSSSIKANPNDPLLAQNLADADIELGGYQEAINIYSSIKDSRPGWSYGIGRAYLYADKFTDALTYAEPVSTDYQRGSARVLEAAALVGLANNETNAKKRSDLLSKALANLKEGVARDSTFWEGVFDGNTRDIHESHTKETSLLAPLYKKLHV